MTGGDGFSRRAMLATSGVLAGGLIASPAMAASSASSDRRAGRLVVYNGVQEAAVAAATAARAQGIAAMAMAGDRIWFGRSLFAPQSGWTHVMGIGDHPDFLLLARHGQEAGFRLISRFEHRPESSAGHGVFPASARTERLLAQSGPGWPAMLVDCVFGSGVAPGMRGGPCRQDGTLYSWVLARRA